MAFLRGAYRVAYETRELEVLRRVWPMDEGWREYVTQLFAESRRLALLIEINEEAVEVKENEQQVVVPFAQAITVVDRQGAFSLQGPFWCVAELRFVESKRWEIEALRDDPRHPGQCRPEA